MSNEQNPKMRKVEGILPLGAMPANEEELKSFKEEIENLGTKEESAKFEKFTLVKKRNSNRSDRTRDRLIAYAMELNPEAIKEYYAAKKTLKI